MIIKKGERGEKGEEEEIKPKLDHIIDTRPIIDNEMIMSFGEKGRG